MATTPPPTTTDPITTVRTVEDPDSLVLRGRLATAEEKQAAAAEAMNATQKALVQALSAPAAPATDAQLWLQLFHVALHGLLRHPTFGTPVAGAEAMASEALAAYRRKFPLVSPSVG